MKSRHKEIKPGFKLYSLLFFLLPVAFSLSIGCKKFLDQKPKLSMVVPQTPNDLQRLLDGSGLNQSSAAGYGEFVADNYYVTDNQLNVYNSANSNTADQVQNYIWGFNSKGRNEYWQFPYTGPIYYSNIVLDQLSVISWDPKDSVFVKALKGSALFIRAFHFFNLAQVYCRPYDAQYLSYPGIVLRLTSDASIIDRSRATVKETYDKIVADLKEAVGLLPYTSSMPTRPCQAAAYAALARVYLSMRDYSNAALYANLALSQRSALLDYNTRIPVGAKPFQTFHVEVIYDDIAAPPVNILSPSNAKIDTTLYRSYDANDLRKVLYFKPNSDGSYRWQGSYNSSANNTPGNLFDGLATDELYLIRAECSARSGNKDSAMNDLNRLLQTRWKSSTYLYMTATDAVDALAKVLIERRKELVYRGQRWTDIRRFNLEGANITLKRIWNGTTYTLPPNDLRTIMLIPDQEIARSGIEQNPR